jgi:large subunit ribosomal protein L9
MKVFLEDDVPNLGVKGEIKEVAPGYFFNFLHTKGLASKATEAKIEEAKKKEEAIKKKKKKKEEEAKKLLEKLEGEEFVLEKTATEESNLYAKVSPEEVVELLEKYSKDIEPGMVVFEDEIKKIGEYQVQINLSQSVVATIKLKVVALEEEEEK